MPLYDYRCTSCGHEFEELIRRLEDAADVHCPACASPKPEKQWAPVALISKDAPPPFCGRCGENRPPCDAR